MPTDKQAVDPRPDRKAALEQYRRAAPGYDRHMRRFARWQRIAVDSTVLGENWITTPLVWRFGPWHSAAHMLRQHA